MGEILDHNRSVVDPDDAQGVNGLPDPQPQGNPAPPPGVPTTAEAGTVDQSVDAREAADADATGNSEEAGADAAGQAPAPVETADAADATDRETRVDVTGADAS